MVETISFGTPTGSARIAEVPIVVPAEPPREISASTFPSACRRETTAAAPRAIAATASPRSRRLRSADREAPPASATSAAATSGAKAGSPTIPVSMTTVFAPDVSTRSFR
jgi:hypothetical protein